MGNEARAAQGGEQDRADGGTGMLLARRPAPTSNAARIGRGTTLARCLRSTKMLRITGSPVAEAIDVAEHLGDHTEEGIQMAPASTTRQLCLSGASR